MVSEKREARLFGRRSLPRLDGGFETREYELTFTVPSGVDADTALKNLEMCVEGLLAEFEERYKPSQPEASKPTAQVPSSPPPLPPGFQTAAQQPTPELSPTYLDGLPWKTETWGQWIFRDTAGAKALSEELEKHGDQITIGNYRYQISKGRDREFINRFEVKKL